MQQTQSNAVLLILALLGAFLFLILNWGPAADEAQTEQAVEPSPAISKHQAAEKATAFITRRFAADRFKAFVNYQSDSELSGYLQRERPADDDPKQNGLQTPTDYYQVELLGQTGKRRYLVNVDMSSGNVTAWTQPDAVAVKASDDSEEVAKSWMRTMGYDIRRFEATRSSEKPFDWIFQRREAGPGEAVFQVRVWVQDGKAIGFQPQYALPETYTSWIDHQQLLASAMGKLNILLMLLLAIAAAVTAIRRRKSIAFHHGLLLVISFAAIYCFHNVNMFPGLKSLPGSDTASAVFTVVFVNIVTLLMAAVVYLSLISGEAMWRGRGIRMLSRWREPSFGKDVTQSMSRGYLVCLFVLGVQSLLFYAAETYWDVWSISDPLDSPLNLFWPLLFPLMAWAAAISEEAIYRLFGIALFKRLLRNTFIAALVPSLIWALGHTSYPIYPVYTRLVEVTVLGLIFSFAFLKYGFFTVLFAHAAMDSILMAFSIMGTGGAGAAAAGLAYMLSPALIAWIIRRLHARYLRRPRGLATLK